VIAGGPVHPGGVERRRRFDARSANSERLNPFIVPFSALPEHGRTTISELLAARGLHRG